MKGNNTTLCKSIRPFLFLILLALLFYHPCNADETVNPPKKLAPGEGIFDHDQIQPAAQWPLWLKDFKNKTTTQETSGITYIGRDENNHRCFLLADDVGMIHFCRIKDNGPDRKSEISLEAVRYTESIFSELRANDKWDFEAIAVTPPSRGLKGLPLKIDGYLSVEGRGENLRETTRILSVQFSRLDEDTNQPLSESEWKIETRGDALPGAAFWKVLMGPNRGIEGLASSKRFLALGLESLEKKGDFNTRGTFLYLYDRETEQAATVRTVIMGIHSITGMHFVDESVAVLMDRNRQRITVLEWEENDNEMWVSSCHHFPLDLPAPDGFRYNIPSVEGITIDDVGDIWCVTDPWFGHYEPVGAVPETLSVYMAAEIPMIYRFAGAPIWQSMNLANLWQASNKEKK